MLHRFFPVLLGSLLGCLLGVTTLPAAEEVGDFEIPAVRPLDEFQLAALRNLVRDDPEAAAMFAQLREQALPLLGRDPSPLRVIHYEGLVHTDPRRLETVSELSDMANVATILNYWQASNDPAAAEALRQQILAWAGIYLPTGNDVNENKLYPLFVAYEVLQNTFPPAQAESIDAWIENLGTLHYQAVRESKRFTNRFAKSLRLLAIYGRILANEEWQEAAINGLKKFVEKSLRAGGGSADLELRDTLTYHTSSLRPVIELAMISNPKLGNLYEWTSDQGGSIKNSVDYVIPFADGSETREEWRNTKVELDRRRAAEGLEAYQPGRLYDPKDATKVLEEASYFDPSLIPLVLKLHGTEAARFPSWTMVINEACRSIASPNEP